MKKIAVFLCLLCLFKLLFRIVAFIQSGFLLIERFLGFGSFLLCLFQ